MEGDISFKELTIGFLIGLIMGVILSASATKNYEEIYNNEGSYTLEYNGKFYELVELN